MKAASLSPVLTPAARTGQRQVLSLAPVIAAVILGGCSSTGGNSTVQNSPAPHKASANDPSSGLNPTNARIQFVRMFNDLDVIYEGPNIRKEPPKPYYIIGKGSVEDFGPVDWYREKGHDFYWDTVPGKIIIRRRLYYFGRERDEGGEKAVLTLEVEPGKIYRLRSGNWGTLQYVGAEPYPNISTNAWSAKPAGIWAVAGTTDEARIQKETGYAPVFPELGGPDLLHPQDNFNSNQDVWFLISQFRYPGMGARIVRIVDGKDETELLEGDLEKTPRKKIVSTNGVTTMSFEAGYWARPTLTYFGPYRFPAGKYKITLLGLRTSPNYEFSVSGEEKSEK